MAMLRSTLMSLAISTMLINLAMATNYTVGGPNGGWDTGTNLQTWASSQSFLVGDNLIFQYTSNHEVVEVSKSDYDSCQSSNPIQSYSGGPTTIPLPSQGKRYFICGTAGHCSQGMKVQIDTLATSSPPPASPSVQPPASSVTPTPAPRSHSSSPTKLPPSPSAAPSIIPSTESPQTPPIGSAAKPPSSSAHQGSFLVNITMGLIFVMTMLQAY